MIVFVISSLISLLEPNSLCRISLERIRPTQLSIGLREVKEREEEVEKIKKNKKKLEEFLKDHPIPFVLGPRSQIFIIDRHHHALGEYLAGLEYAYGILQADLSKIRSMKEFWTEMDHRGWVYPVDPEGHRHPTEVMQKFKKLWQLLDDPYRSLAGIVRDKGGFEKTEVPYAEFLWGNYFRKSGIDVGRSNSEFKDAVKAALKIAHHQDARDLPGYIPEKN